jgi:hypothetical protein
MYLPISFNGNPYLSDFYIEFFFMGLIKWICDVPNWGTTQSYIRCQFRVKLISLHYFYLDRLVCRARGLVYSLALIIFTPKSKRKLNGRKTPILSLRVNWAKGGVIWGQVLWHQGIGGGFATNLPCLCWANFAWDFSDVHIEVILVQVRGFFWASWWSCYTCMSRTFAYGLILNTMF